jgi:hypothetical protein
MNNMIAEFIRDNDSGNLNGEWWFGVGRFDAPVDLAHDWHAFRDKKDRETPEQIQELNRSSCKVFSKLAVA